MSGLPDIDALLRMRSEYAGQRRVWFDRDLVLVLGFRVPDGDDNRLRSGGPCGADVAHSAGFQGFHPCVDLRFQPSDAVSAAIEYFDRHGATRLLKKEARPKDRASP